MCPRIHSFVAWTLEGEQTIFRLSLDGVFGMLFSIMIIKQKVLILITADTNRRQNNFKLFAELYENIILLKSRKLVIQKIDGAQNSYEPGVPEFATERT